MDILGIFNTLYIFFKSGISLFYLRFKPSFNSATAQEEGQLRAVVNTYLAIAASCIMTFAVSKWLGKGKLNMVNIKFLDSYNLSLIRFR